MTESELLRRIDRHLERADQHMERGNAIMAEANEIHRDHRELIREMTVRQERVTRTLVEQIRAGMSELVKQIDANTRELIAGRAVLADIGLATRQHTAALARIMDRLG